MVWGIQYYTAAVAAAGGNGVLAGLFIPIANLPGITQGSELADASKERKAAYSLLGQVFDRLDTLSSKLGISNAKSQAVSTTVDRINQTFALTATFRTNHASNGIGPLPLPTGNAGSVPISTLFPAAALVAAEGAIPGAGILVPNTMLSGYGVSALTNVANDGRQWIAGLCHSMVKDMDANAALVSASRGTAVGVAPAANFTGANAITGLTEADLAVSSFFSTTYTIGLQIALNQATQTFDLAS